MPSPLDAAELVTAFCASWATGDLDTITSFFAEDALYHNIPLRAIHGMEPIRRGIQAFLGSADSVTFDVHSQVADGNLVMNERVDTFVIDGHRIDVPAAGSFVVDAGKIVVWRDYFDLGQASAALGTA